MGAALLLSLTPAALGQTLKGGVQQNDTNSSNGTASKSDSHGSGSASNDEFHSNSGYGPTACDADRSGPQPYTKLWGQPDHITPAEAAGPNRERWIRCAMDPCHPGYVQCWRNPNYKPVRGKYGHYVIPASGDYAPPYVPPIPGGVNVCNDPNAWRIPQCNQGGPGRSTQPIGPARPTNSPASISDGLQYLRGIQQGLGDCAKAGLDLFAAAASMARGDFVTATQTLGLQPGQSIALRTIVGEARTQVIGVSPFEAGRIAGRRICAYGLIPGIGRAAKSLGGIRTPGNTPYNPIRGAAIAENSGSLAGKWIRTPSGTVQLGPLLGSGAFGDVYRIAGQPGKVMKLSNAKPISAPSFARQVAGSSSLQNAGVSTPRIYDAQFGGPGQPSYLVMDDIGARWPGAQIFSDIQQLGPAQMRAIQNLYDQISDHGLVWADGHSSNIFFESDAGGLTAGVVDSDMVFPASQFAAQDAFVKNTVGNILIQTGQQGLLFRGFNAQQMMKALFQARYE